MNVCDMSSHGDRPLCQTWLLFSLSVFCYYLPLVKGRGIWFEQTWIHFTLRCVVPSLLEIGQVEKKIFKFRQCIFIFFSNNLPLGKGRGPSLNKLESPSLKDAFCKVWLKLALLFFKFRQGILSILLLSPLGKGRGPSFKLIWFPFTQGWFVPSLVEIGPVVLEKKMKMCNG